MAETKALTPEELTVTSLAKALMALNNGHPLSDEQRNFFQHAAHAERTWNPIKQNDLVPVSEILDVEEVEWHESEQKAWDKNFSAVQRVMLQNLDLKLKAMARQLITKARDGSIDASALVPVGDSVWEKRACELLRSTLQLVQREGG